MPQGGRVPVEKYVIYMKVNDEESMVVETDITFAPAATAFRARV